MREREQRERVGKYFCYVDRMVGIQVDEQKQVSSGRIKPDPEKFFVTIKETDENMKRSACDLGVYGLNYAHLDTKNGLVVVVPETM